MPSFQCPSTPTTKNFSGSYSKGRPTNSIAYPSAYENKTKLICGDETKLLISFIKPHKAVTSSSVARWLKSVLSAAGIDTAIFSLHSTMGASTSAAANVGITTNNILKAANWSSESVFQKFYYKPSDNASYGKVILSTSATNNTVDMRD